MEGLVNAFSKLVSPKTANSVESKSLGTSKGASHHNFVECDAIRYLFRPLDNIGFLVLATTVTSNIVQDVETLQSCFLLINEVCPAIGACADAFSILNLYIQHKFEFALAFDEVVCTGDAESLSAGYLTKILSMESQDEIIENAIIQVIFKHFLITFTIIFRLAQRKRSQRTPEA